MMIMIMMMDVLDVKVAVPPPQSMAVAEPCDETGCSSDVADSPSSSLRRDRMG